MNNEKLKDYLSKGTEIAGAAVGGAIELISGPAGVAVGGTIGLIIGPAGAILGGALGTAITIGVKEFISRQLSNRQEVRIAASTAFILMGVKNRIENGETIRNDSFFQQNGNRSSAQELFEGVLIKCKEEYQEKKIQYVTKIFEKTIFDKNISPETANQILSIAEKYTYRKICIISFFNRKEDFNTSLLMKEPYSWYENATYTLTLEILKQDIFELANDGILDQNGFATFTKEDIIPFDYKLTTIGETIFKMMDLHLIPRLEIESIYNELIYKAEFGINDKGKINGQ